MDKRLARIAVYLSFAALLVISLGVIPLFYSEDLGCAVIEEERAVCGGVGTKPVKAPDAPANYEMGQQLFADNCQTCHKLYEKMIGPPLAGIYDKHDSLWVVNFTLSPMKMIEENDSAAVAIYKEYNMVAMVAFEGILSEEELKALHSYLQYTTLD